jgi:hypothetical protein
MVYMNIIRAFCSLAFVASAVAATACGSPADVAGAYSISITNKENGCGFANWTVGATSVGIPATVTQQGENASAEIGGGAGVVLDLLLGSRSYVGSVDGDDVSLRIQGTRGQTKGNCAYTWNSNLSATLNGDVLTGSIEYTTATNGNSDCATIAGCVSSQAFNGTRPPR